MKTLTSKHSENTHTYKHKVCKSFVDTSQSTENNLYTFKSSDTNDLGDI